MHGAALPHPKGHQPDNPGLDGLAALLSQWNHTAGTNIPCSKLRLHKALQPRDETLAPAKDRHRLSELSLEHVERLSGQLDASLRLDLDPILVAAVDGNLWVVDGHHRLKAYRRARRPQIPGRILEMPWWRAVLASKLVNLGGVKLPMHREQAKEAAWQYLAFATDRGRRALSTFSSLRETAGRFGCSHDTISRMVKQMPQVNPEDYTEAAKDAGTDWPRWKYVRGSAAKSAMDALPLDFRTRWKAERCAKQLARLRDSAGQEVFALAVEILKDEFGSTDAGETLGQLGKWAGNRKESAALG